ncbi:hypothetical protein [Amycolatopsis benzoatilytica]|uniref:hypothetical protein n=1 Tax=Amycolatopsis benzoatilytica TaxID=346045 RepID=UPI00037E7057|nr:hypothetical protein [Amycolatopsis benzoatilytica]
MIGFETELSDLRKASGLVGNAGDAAETARAGVGKLGVDVSNGMPGAPWLDPFGLAGSGTAFGGTLGMPEVAKAYEAHRAKVEDALAKLAATTQQTSEALKKVAELYETSDANAQSAIRRAAGEVL